MITETFTTPFTEHAFMEPECAIGYPYADGVLVYAGDQSVYDDQREIARMLCLPKEKVRIKSTLVGGGFGGKEDMSVQHHAALAAYVLKRPVNMKLSRQESLMVHPKRHPMTMTMTLGARKDGRINGLKAEILSDTGAYASRPILIPELRSNRKSTLYEQCASWSIQGLRSDTVLFCD